VLQTLKTEEGRAALYEEGKRLRDLNNKRNTKKKNRPELTTEATYVDRPKENVFSGGSRKHFKRGNKKLIRKSIRKYKRRYTSKIRR
jgi:hypothetical protein